MQLELKTFQKNYPSNITLLVFCLFSNSFDTVYHSVLLKNVIAMVFDPKWHFQVIP